MAQHIEDFCEDKARAGDGSFAVAYAVLRLARAQAETAKALHRLGNADAATPMGAIEHLGQTMKEGMEQLATAISELRPD